MKKEFPKGSRGKLSQHLDLSEVHCHCRYENCTSTVVDTDAVAAFEKLRAKIREPIRIERWYSCSAHNRDVGGKPGSRHMSGDAFDFKVKGFNGRQLAAIAEEFPEFQDGGIGTYKVHPNLCHVDTRGHRARWAQSEYNDRLENFSQGDSALV